MKHTPKPFDSGYLEEKDGHKVWFAQFGNKKGPAILTLHGGPGAKSKPKHVKGYELDIYHVTTFDQRGCGKSLPAGETQSNNLDFVIEDIERLRKRLKIESWFVAGGSWGSTLAIAYAQKHPKVIKGLLLSSIFLARKCDVDWAFSQESGVSRIFPDLWKHRVRFLDKHKTTPQKAAKVLLDKLNTCSKEEAEDIVAAVSNWEGNLMNAFEDLKFIEPDDVCEEDIAATKVFLHYEANDFFLDDNQLLQNIDKICDIPTVIVHGRYDLLCPLEQMWELQKRLKDIETVILPTSNHKLTAEGEIARNLAFNYFLSKQVA